MVHADHSEAHLWPVLREHLHAALALPAEDRGAYLRAHVTDSETLKEAESLLRLEELAGEMFCVTDWHGQASLDHEAADAQPRSSIGNYKIISELGRGGMGTVYLAERNDGSYEQRVAIKVLQDNVSSPDMEKRFRSERQILAGLVHPGIARLLDGGVTQSGRAYLVLEYVEGVPIDAFCEGKKFGIRERLNLFLKVAEIVQVAHQQLVLHLDLKPANILITAEGEPRLLDFGIARFIGAEGVVQPSILLMTPRYASPEQAEGKPLGVSSDIFSMGTLLYRLLTGTMPYPIEDASPLEIARMIKETDPKPPSKARTDGQSAELRGELDLILLKALRKEPSRRYPTIAAFANDIDAYLTSRPVLAYKGDLAYRAGKFIRRNRLITGVVAVALLLISVSVAAVVRSAIQARRARSVAESRLRDVRSLAHSYIFDLDPMLEDLPGTIAVRHFVLQNAQKYLEAMSKEAVDDDDLARETADGYLQIGRVQATPGIPSMTDLAGGATSKNKGLAIQRRLLAKHPENEKDRRQLIRQLINVSNLYEFLGDVSRQETVNLETWQVGQPFVDAGPTGKNYLLLSVVAWQIAALHCGNSDGWSFADPVGALPWLDRAELIANTYQSHHPEDSNNGTVRAVLSRVAMSRAATMLQLGRKAEARALYEHALEVTKDPTNELVEQQARKQLLGFYADLLLLMGDARGAEAAAPKLQPNAVHEKEHDRQLSSDDAEELTLLARVDLQRGRVVQGREKMRKGLNTLELLHKTEPLDGYLTAQLAWDTFRVAEEAALDEPTRVSLYKRSIEVASEVEKKSPEALSTSLLIGRCYIGLADVARVSKRSDEQTAYADAAMASLTRVRTKYAEQPQADALLNQAKALTKT